MQYLLMICYDETFTPSETMGPETEAWVEEMDRRGVRTTGDRLRPPADATTVRVRDGEVLLTDGPFAETKEQMAGYDLIECENLDEAIEVASKHPMAKAGLIEARPPRRGRRQLPPGARVGRHRAGTPLPRSPSPRTARAMTEPEVCGFSLAIRASTHTPDGTRRLR